MKFLQFTVGTVSRAATAGFRDNMIASYSKAIQKTVNAVQEKNILLSPVISEIMSNCSQSFLTKGYEVTETAFMSTFPKISHVTGSVFKTVGIRYYSTSAYCSEQKKKDLTVAVGSEKLKYTLLIDNDETYIVPGQEKNLLRINGKSAVYDLCNCIKIPQDQKILQENICKYESFRTFNKLFYAAGVLRDMCDTYSRVDRDLVDIMWEDHGFKVEPKRYGCNYEVSSQSYELLKRFELYQSGLEVLGEITISIL